MEKFKKTIVLVLVFVFIFSPILSTRASAQFFVPTWSVEGTVTAANTTSMSLKELGFDGVAFMIINIVLEKMAASTIKWINSGFKGSPAFVTDPERYFRDIGDGIAGDYIFKNPNLNFLCGPISARVKLALARSYTNQNIQWQCTLTDVYGNIDDFMNDFSKGGWDKFFKLTQEPQNNPLGAYLQAENLLNQKITNKTNEKLQQLNWGQGFLSFETCEEKDADGTCIGRAKISTPGSVISDQLNKQLGLGSDRIAAADEINEIISALLNQLVGRVIGGIGKGLSSLTDKDASNNNTSFTEQLSNESKDAQIDEYFKDSLSDMQDVIGTPPYDPSFCRNNPTSPDCLPPGSGAPNNSEIPLDTDCANLDINILKANADRLGLSVKDLDCEPVGIH